MDGQGAACVWVRDAVADRVDRLVALWLMWLRAELLHARFALGPRQRIEASVSARFGEEGQPCARRFAKGMLPSDAAIVDGLTPMGWPKMRYDSVGFALKLGVAQGYNAGKLAELSTAEGLTEILINTAELRALAQMPVAQGPMTWSGIFCIAGRCTVQYRLLDAGSGHSSGSVGAVRANADRAVGLTATGLWSGLRVARQSQCLRQNHILANVVHQDQHQPRVQGVTVCVAQTIMGGDQTGIGLIRVFKVGRGDQHADSMAKAWARAARVLASSKVGQRAATC